MMNIETQGQRHMREEGSPKKPSPMPWSLKVPQKTWPHAVVSEGSPKKPSPMPWSLKAPQKA